MLRSGSDPTEQHGLQVKDTFGGGSMNFILLVVCVTCALVGLILFRQTGGPRRSRALRRAIAIARKAHHGQVDKGGAPYILHPLRMMARVFTEEEKIAAVLHDVVEDGGVSLSALRAEGFSERVIAAVDALTRRPGETYEDFVLRAAANDLGRSVKLADLFDNCDLSRIPHPTPADYERLHKYQRAIVAIRSLNERPADEDAGTGQPRLPNGSSIEVETRFVCCLCGKEAGHILLLRTARGVEVLRRSFTSTMGGGGTPWPKEEGERIRAAIERHDARGLFDVNFELTPFYCPTCDACYCGDHWTRWDVFDEDAPSFHDCIRGRCPNGHERMLED